MLTLLFVADACAQGQRPNILWITSEDNGPHLGCYGDVFADTPNLDALAARGLRYVRAWSNAPVCAPARTTIITGMYATTLGAEHMRSMVKLPEGMLLFPQNLREAGYYCTNNSKEDYNVRKPGQVWDASSRSAHWRNRAEGQPFFAVVNITITHESRIRSRPHEPVHDPAHVRVPAYHPDHPTVRRDWAQYYDRMTEMDTRVGRILQDLEDDGLADDTIVFYFGDHGPGMPRCKRWLYDSGLRVPMIIVVPDRFAVLAPPGYAAGSPSDRLVSFVDLAPTVLSLAGLAPPAFMQGRAFAGAHVTTAPEFLHGYRGRMDERVDLVRSITDGRFVYIRNFMPHRPQGVYLDYMFQTPTTRLWRDLYDQGVLEHPGQRAFWEPKPVEELYDLTTDPDEVRNLLAGDRIDDDVERTRSRLSTALHEHLVSSRDLGFLPEDELHRRAGDGAPHDVGRVMDDAERARAWSAVTRIARQGGLPDATTAAPPDSSRSDRIDRAEAALLRGDAASADDARATLLAGADLEQSSLYLAVRALNAIDATDAIARWPDWDVDRLRALPRTHDDIPGRLGNYVPRLLDHILERHPPPREERVYRTVDGVELSLFIHHPRGEPPVGGRPAVVFFHGGGWSGGNPNQFFDHCAHLARHGLVGISVTYRLGRKHGTTPYDCVADGKSALRWVRAHAAELGVDPDRIGAGGGSAGGHIAATVATVDGFDDEPDSEISCRPNALILFNPVFDNGPDGWGYARVKDRWQEFSPMHNVRPGIPPSLVMLGTHDTLIPVETAHRWQTRVVAAGGRCDVVLYQGQGHGFFNRSRNAEMYAATVADMDAFLTSLGWRYLSAQ